MRPSHSSPSWSVPASKRQLIRSGFCEKLLRLGCIWKLFEVTKPITDTPGGPAMTNWPSAIPPGLTCMRRISGVMRSP